MNGPLDNDIEEVLFTEQKLQQRIGELAEAINRDYHGTELALVSVLRGSIFFITDLAVKLDIPLTMDFMAISEYGPRTAHGVVRIIKDLDDEIQGRHVLVVEDIIDTGLTLNYLLNTLRPRSPASLAVCTLLDRPSLRIVEDLPVSYVGFELEDVFVVGYGLDYRQRYRNLPYIGILKEQIPDRD